MSSKDKSDAKIRGDPKSSDRIKAEEWEKFCDEVAKAHPSYILKPLLTLSSILSVPVLPAAILFLLPFFTFLLVSPPYLSPHIASLLTLVVPIQLTLRSLAIEIGVNEDLSHFKGGSAQWCVYWGAYGLLGLIGGGFGVWREGWKGWWEVWRAVCLVILGGPWFSRDALLASNEPSKALQAALSREAAEKKKREQAEDAAADKREKKEKKEDEKAKKARDKAEKDQREKDKRDRETKDRERSERDKRNGVK